MPRSGLIWLVFLLSVLLFGVLPASALVPEIIVEAPPELEATAQRLRTLDPAQLSGIVEIVGLGEPGPPIQVILAPEGSENAVSTPSWVSGYAYGALGVIVLLPERSPSYPDSNLPELLRHELAHVLIARAAGGQPVPRWFNEGLATLAADVWRLSDRSRLALALVLRGESSLEDVERMFSGDSGQIARAYAQSSAFVRDMALRYRETSPAEILALVRIGVPFEEAFLRGTGQTLAGAERSFWRRHSFWYRWFPILTSSISGWTFITFLFLLAAYLKRRKTEKLQQAWDEEERWLRESSDDERGVGSGEPLLPN